MALESPSTHVRTGSRRHLEAVEAAPRRETVYTSPARAALVLRRLIVGSVLVVAFVLAWTFGYDLLRAIGIAFLVLVGIGASVLAIILAIDALRSKR